MIMYEIITEVKVIKGCNNCESDYKNVIFKLYMLQFQGPVRSCHMSFQEGPVLLLL